VAKEPGAWSTKPQHHWREERAKVHWELFRRPKTGDKNLDPVYRVKAYINVSFISSVLFLFTKCKDARIPWYHVHFIIAEGSKKSFLKERAQTHCPIKILFDLSTSPQHCSRRGQKYQRSSGQLRGLLRPLDCFCWSGDDFLLIQSVQVLKYSSGCTLL
jgi:hypothetical protein